MLHAKELRFGNKVLSENGEIITVQQILGNTLVYDTQIKVSREMAVANRSYQTAHSTHFIYVVKEAEFQELEPIVLTPKVLEKCGFRNFVREEWILSIGNSHMDFVFNADGLRLRHPTPSWIGIRYVHQLQNFLFAITGHELTTEL